MAYVNPRTWAAGETVTAALMNAQVRDQFLAIAGTDGKAPGCRVYHDNTQATTNDTLLTLAFNSERFDTDAFHDTVTNNSRLTIPAGMGGRYLIFAAVSFAANATGLRNVNILLNAATQLASVSVPAVGAWTADLDIATVYDLAANDYVQIRVKQTSGGGLNVLSTGSYSPEFGLVRL